MPMAYLQCGPRSTLDVFSTSSIGISRSDETARRRSFLAAIVRTQAFCFFFSLSRVFVQCFSGVFAWRMSRHAACSSPRMDGLLLLLRRRRRRRLLAAGCWLVSHACHRLVLVRRPTRFYFHSIPSVQHFESKEYIYVYVIILHRCSSSVHWRADEQNWLHIMNAMAQSEKHAWLCEREELFNVENSSISREIASNVRRTPGRIKQ